MEAEGVRCWGDGDPLLTAYHDHEWGRPVTDERGMFERICLEGFQAGLSWRTVLGKREALRRAFAGFAPEAVAEFGAADIARLLGDAAIIRSRAKIEAAVANARATLALRAHGGLVALVWSFRPESAAAAPRATAELPASTPASTALARALRTAGFRFVGPTTAYATMQAAGLVNDHVAACRVRHEVDALQAAARALPRPAIP